MISIDSGEKVYRVSGNAENIITAVTEGFWGHDAANKTTWNAYNENDVIIFHAVLESSFLSKTKTKSCIVGWARVGSKKSIKDYPVWIQEFDYETQLNAGVKLPEENDFEVKSWPYIFELKDIHLLVDDESIFDFDEKVNEKNPYQILKELEYVFSEAIPLNELNRELVSKGASKFAHMGSVSGFTDQKTLIEALNTVLNHRKTLSLEGGAAHFDSDEFVNIEAGSVAVAAIAELTEEQREAIKTELSKFDDSDQEHYSEGTKNVRTRKESTKQKADVAKLEGFSCQVCGYKVHYYNKKGEFRWIGDVDHILMKSDGYGETIDNLWVLCPSCHREKTYGVLEIDPFEKSIKRFGQKIELHHDAHLDWPKIKVKDDL